MPDASIELRVYCVCGQKMKVTEDMFGLPAKCVACRRKIRIPAREDVAPDLHEIYLKDHPELLRKGKKSRKTVAVASQPPAAYAEKPDRALVPVPPGEHAGHVPEILRPVPLDPLRQLQEIASLRNKVLRELRKSRMAAAGSPPDKAVLKGYLAKLDDARAHLDRQVRQKRVEVGAELAAVREKIVQTGLLARLEEITFSTYQNMVDRLRRQRDRLERMSYNLDAWLDVRDPRSAGGYVSRSFEQIPEADFDVEWPVFGENGEPMLDEHLHALREGLQLRARAKKKLEETARLRAMGTVEPSSVAEIRAEAKIEKRRGEAQIRFHRKCLEEFGRDTASDVQTIHACLDGARKRMAENALERPSFEALEHELLRAQRECARSHDIVTRALIAGTAQDVPEPRVAASTPAPERVKPEQAARARKPFGSVLDYPGTGLGLDSWVAWSGALMLAVSVFLPVVGNLSPLQTCKTLAFQGAGIYWVMAAPILAGAAIVAVGAIPRRPLRGALLLSLWFVLTLLAVFILHESRYSPSAAAERFHKGGDWLLRPGVVLMLLANVTLLAAASAALCVKRSAWLAIAAVIGMAALAGAVQSSDWMGTLVPMPSLTVNSTPATDTARPLSEVNVAVGNTGTRSLFLASVQSMARNAFVYQFQKKSGPDAWSDVPLQRVGLSGPEGAPGAEAPPSHFRTLTIEPGRVASFYYSCPPGEYRVQLLDVRGAFEPLTSTLAVEAPEPPAAPTPQPALTPPPTERPDDQPARPTVEPPAEIELKGTLIGPDREPRFSILLHVPGKAPESIDALLGDKIHGEWLLSEYNPLRQTLTIMRDSEVLIVTRGKRIPLEAAWR